MLSFVNELNENLDNAETEIEEQQQINADLKAENLKLLNILKNQA